MVTMTLHYVPWLWSQSIGMRACPAVNECFQRWQQFSICPICEYEFIYKHMME